MSFNTIRLIEEAFEDKNEHANLQGTEIRGEDELVVLHFETSVADDLADKAHNYILQGWNDSWFPNDSIGVEELGEQSFCLYVGPTDAIPTEECKALKEAKKRGNSAVAPAV